MRRQIALLVAATTTLIMLAFVIPLAVLVDRVADSNGVAAAQNRSQVVVPLVAAGDDDGATEAARAASQGGVTVVVRLPSGQLVGAEEESWEGGAPTRELRSTAVRRLGDESAVVDQPVFRQDGMAVISARVEADVLDRGVHRAWLILTTLGVVLLGLSLVVGDRLARSVTRPVEALAQVADRLGGGDLTASTVPLGPPEIREVGAALNTLAGRIRDLMASERESIADLSHRLRTPITALRLDAEALHDPVERGRLSEDVDLLVGQVNEVIAHARRPVSDEATAPPECDVAAVVADRMQFWDALAQEQGRHTTVDLAQGPCRVMVGADDIAAALDALLDNIFAHTKEGTAFSVAVHSRFDGFVALTVSDEGTGFPKPAVQARGASGAGSTGLGLDIALRTARAAGGDAQIMGGPRGATVVLRLPKAPRPTDRPRG